jgi:histone deacetylase HOS3
MSSRGHSIPPVVVKKTRAPAQPRNETSTTSRVRRKSPLNDSGASAHGNDGTMEVPLRSSSVVLPTTELSNSQSSDIDDITSGMRKVKLNLTTKAQREAKDQAKLAAKTASTKPAKPVPVKATTSRPAEKLPMSTMPMLPVSNHGQLVTRNGNPSVLQPQLVSLRLPPMPSTPQASLPSQLTAHLQQAAQVPLPASSPPRPTFIQTAPAPSRPGTGSDIFIPYQPEGPPPDTMIQQEPLRWLPPNTATPPPMKKADLPVFTATSAIPFGVNSNLGPKTNGEPQPVESSRLRDDSIWEVPETPRK